MSEQIKKIQAEINNCLENGAAFAGAIYRQDMNLLPTHLQALEFLANKETLTSDDICCFIGSATPDSALDIRKSFPVLWQLLMAFRPENPRVLHAARRSQEDAARIRAGTWEALNALKGRIK